MCRRTESTEWNSFCFAMLTFKSEATGHVHVIVPKQHVMQYQVNDILISIQGKS